MVEEFKEDYEWMKYEGKIIHDDYIKYVVNNPDYESNKENIMKECFNDITLKHFYILGTSLRNLIAFIPLRVEIPHEFNSYIYDRYKNNKENLKDFMIGDIKFCVYDFQNTLISYRTIIKLLTPDDNAGFVRS